MGLQKHMGIFLHLESRNPSTKTKSILSEQWKNHVQIRKFKFINTETFPFNNNNK